MDERKVAEVMVISAMAFKQPTRVVRHFLNLADTVPGITDDLIHDAVGQLQHKLGESPTDAPRLLLGIELVLAMCGQDEKQVAITSRVEKVLKQYAKILTEMILENDSVTFANCGRFKPFSRDDYELVLDIAQFIAVSAGQDSAGAVNTLIRTIVARAPEEVLEAKICQLESPDFCRDRKENRERFHEVFAVEYLKRSYGMWQVLMRLRHPQSTKLVTRDDWEHFASMHEEQLWETLRRICEVTEPTSSQLVKRQLITSELMRRYHDDNLVINWYRENFPHLVRI
ncbi:MAG: hypothetical protein M1429_02845 [Patescibacteria group bacterium]|nr:hypothetical protein [Patescibacteria group bacterium]